MKCKDLLVRSKNYSKYLYCRKKKRNISYDNCKKCIDFKLNETYKLKNKSKKLANAERKRFSILTNNLKICYVCGKKKDHIHEIYKGANRQVSIKNGFCVPLCNKCHIKTETDIVFLRKLQIECQKTFEKNHTREEFMKLTGRSYL